MASSCADAFKETPSTFSTAAFFENGEILARIDVPGIDQVDFSYFDPPHCYLRLIRMAPLRRPLSVAELKAAAADAPLLKQHDYGHSVAINLYGVIAFDPGSSPSGKLARFGLGNAIVSQR
jgi:hypothetical protein